MARPLRITFPGAVYHITSRGNERRKIFRADPDRRYFLKLLSKILKKYDWICHSYCLMDNHYHLLIETNKPTLSQGMRQLNGTYTQWFNLRHGRVGHLLQGRFKAILVEKNSHLLELSRYVVLNPVRAGMCAYVGDYPWSSYRETVGLAKSFGLVQSKWILSLFAEDPKRAVPLYAQFVQNGIDDKPWDRLKGGIYFGSDAFIEESVARSKISEEIPKEQLIPLRPPLEELLRQENGVWIAYNAHDYRLKELAKALGKHYSTVSRQIKQIEAGMLQCKT